MLLSHEKKFPRQMTRSCENGERFTSLFETKFPHCVVRFTAKDCTSVRLNFTGLISIGGFSLSRKFYVRANVNLAGFTYVNKTRSDVREPRA